MLFTCPKCRTQYNFDESQIPPEGVAVQCTNCPQIFEVRVPAPAPRPIPQQIPQPMHQPMQQARPQAMPPMQQQLPQMGNNGYNNNQQWSMGPVIPTPMTPSYTPTNSDYLAIKPKKHYFLRAFGTIILVLVIGGGAFYIAAPDSFDHTIGQPVKTLLGLDKISPEAQAAFDQAQAKVNKWEPASLDEASNLLFQATRLQKDYVAAIALSAQVKLMQADMQMEQLYWLEKENQQPEQQTKLRLAANHNSEEAFNAAKRALELSPNNRVALRVMIDYYRHKKAGSQAQVIIDQAKNFPNDYLNITLGMAAIEESDTSAAGESLLLSGLEKLPDYNHGRYYLAKYYYENDKIEAAKKILTPMLQDVPNHELANKLMAAINKPAPEPQPAVKGKGKNNAPAAAPAVMTTAQLLNRAKLLRGNDRTKEALAIYEKITDEDSSNIQAHLGMGWCYIDMGYTTPAITSFKQVLAININNAEAYYGLAEAYKAQKNKNEAIKNYQLFIQLAPNHPEAGIAKRAMENLKN